MTLLFFTFTLILTSAAILFALYMRHHLVLFVVAMFFMAFVFTTKTTDYIGYALDSEFVTDGSEALVLSLTETADSFYVVVLFKDDEPRLIRIAKVDGDDEMSKAGKGSKILRFGDVSGEAFGKGDGTESERSGVRVLDLNESTEFDKGE